MKDISVNVLRRHLPLLLLLFFSGCFNFSYNGKPPTIARELTELKKLRDRGTITAQEFEMGKCALLHQQPHTNPEDPGIQVAVRPAVNEGLEQPK